MKFDKDLCLNLRNDFGKMNSTLGSVVPLAMFLEYFPYSLLFVSIFKKKQIVVKLKQVIFTTFVSSLIIV